MSARHGIQTLAVSVVLGVGAASWTLSEKPAGFAQQTVERFQVAPNVTLALPSPWRPAESTSLNARQFIAVTGPPGAQEITARATVTSETHDDRSAVLDRLVEIAREYAEPAAVIELGGWPALERRRLAPLEYIGQNVPVDPPNAVYLTTAVAWNNQLVRIETVVAPGADETVGDQALAVARSAVFPTRAPAAQLEADVAELRRRVQRDLPVATPQLAQAVGAAPAADVPVMGGNGLGTAVLAGAGGEIEIAVSNDGRNVVIGTNGGYSFSDNGGATFTIVGGGVPAGFPNGGDPSLAFGVSGNFYFAYIGLPTGQAAANNVNGCTTGVSVSIDNGQNFGFRNHATICPATGAAMCFPDQEHIAADSRNAAAAGGDQVYSVWRNFAPVGALPASCRAIRGGTVATQLVCSNDGGLNWGGAVNLGAGDFPRVAVGGNGNVYVVYINGGNVMLNRYTSCNAGLTQIGTPVTVAAFTGVRCPVPGLDRCNNGNVLSSPTVAVDNTNANHIYVAYSSSTGAGNENVMVVDSVDAGATWRQPVRVNRSVTGRRYMPWVCAAGGDAYVTWYDRRPATTGANDLTDFYLGTATVENGVLVAGLEENLSINPDAQCASGWPCGSRNLNDSESCAIQPQLAGRCQLAGGGGSNQACDLSAPTCPAFETCTVTGNGCPKYGDYNGVACGGGRIVAAWSSATAPPGLTAPAGRRVFAETRDPFGAVLTAVGTVVFLRVHEAGTGYGPPTDFLDAEVIIQLNSRPGLSFGFQLRPDNNETDHLGMLATLRDAFETSGTVRIDYIRTGLRNHRLIRVQRQ